MKAFCIYGPPGTGKTTELVRLINEVIDRNPARSNAVVFLSHTKVAAHEAVRRGQCKLPQSNAMTLHSLCFRTCGFTRAQVVQTDRLVKFGEEVGMPISGNSPDSERELTEADYMMALYDLARARLQEPAEAYELSDRPGSLEEFKYLVRSYESWKQAQGLVDFTDMLKAAGQSRVEQPFRAFFVDEAQDLSALQRQTLYHLARDAALVYMAGDDDQAIFEWAGADPAGMPEFETRFSAQRRVLGVSHRVPAAVHRLAEEVIGRVDSRVPKEYRPRAVEGVVERLAGVEQLDFSRPTAVLYRDRSVRAPLEEHLQAELIPYRALVGFPAPLQTKAGRTIKMLNAVFNGERPEPQVLRALEDRLTERGKQALAAGYSHAGFHWGDYVTLPFRTAHYLENVNLEAPEQIISSIHSFKGAEYPVVALCTGMAARTYANLSNNQDQEHRTFYVGVTRARDELLIVEGANAYEL